MGESDNADRGRRGRFSSAHGEAVRPVMVLATAEGLEVRDEMGLLIASWKTADLRADGVKGGGVRLRCAAEPGARLDVEDGVYIRDKTRPSGAQRQPRLRLQIAVAAVVVLVGAAAAVLWRPVNHRQGLAAPPVVATLPYELRPCLGPAGQEALSGLGTRLAAGLPPAERPGRVVVVQGGRAGIVRLEDGSLAVPAAVVTEAAAANDLAVALAEAMAPGRRLAEKAGIGPNRPPALRDAEWQALKGICR